MQVPKGFYVLHQPKYRTPSVFDLNDRGRVTSRPTLSSNVGFRLLVDAAQNVKVQCALFRDGDRANPSSGNDSCRLQKIVMALSDTLELDEKAFAGQVEDAAAEVVTAGVRQWRANFFGDTEDGGFDRNAIAAKLSRAYEECQISYCRNLARHNRDWVQAALPRLLFDFKRTLFRDVRVHLLPAYRENGGEDSEDDLVRKIMLFYRVLDNCESGDLLKPNGLCWQDEDEIWDCWIGFAGSEAEAKRICRTLGAVLLPLAERMNGA